MVSMYLFDEMGQLCCQFLEFIGRVLGFIEIVELNELFYFDGGDVSFVGCNLRTHFE